MDLTSLPRWMKYPGANEEDPWAKKPQDDLKSEVILNPSEALRRGVTPLARLKRR
jgi:hypothetical protein